MTFALTHQKEDAVTVVLTANAEANRLIGFDGAYATSAGNGHDVQGVSECAGVIGDAIAVVTEYSYIVDVAEPIQLHAYVKPAADGSGRAAVGTATNNCGIAIAVSDTKIELAIQRHIHP
jgi:hypothetical protein